MVDGGVDCVKRLIQKSFARGARAVNRGPRQGDAEAHCGGGAIQPGGRRPARDEPDRPPVFEHAPRSGPGCGRAARGRDRAHHGSRDRGDRPARESWVRVAREGPERQAAGDRAPATGSGRTRDRATLRFGGADFRRDVLAVRRGGACPHPRLRRAESPFEPRGDRQAAGPDDTPAA